MFHTLRQRRRGWLRARAVVIPWRGFRCFTPQEARLYELVGKMKFVVIPWRGFRCFTLGKGDVRTGDGASVVVIPWRGFRCFTRPKVRLVWGYPFEINKL